MGQFWWVPFVMALTAWLGYMTHAVWRFIHALVKSRNTD